jgi:hypothetical protein
MNDKCSLASGKINICFGAIVMIGAAFAGFALGQSLDPYYSNGYGQITLWRMLTRAGHTHGMTFGLINIVFGLLLDRLGGSVRQKRILAALAMVSVLLPIGVCLRGLTQGATFAELLAMVGGFSLLGACGLLLVCVRRGFGPSGSV